MQLLSIFSGGGFLDLGFINQGFQIVDAIESHEAFVDCYNEGTKSYVTKSQKNIFKNSAVSSFNISKTLDATSPDVQNNLEKNFKNITGIIGGSPCQDFSQGGSNKGVEGDRGKLIFTYLEIVSRINPLFIFFENVSGLYKSKIHQVGFFDLKNQLERDYHLWYEVLNALDYGVPQDRARLTLVGFRKDVIKKLIDNDFKLILQPSESENHELIFKWPSKKFPSPKTQEWPKIWRFGSEVITKDINPIPKSYYELFVDSAFAGLNNSSPNQQEHFIPYSKKFTKIKEGDTSGKSFKRLHRYRYSPTVAYGNNEVHLHPTEPRRISVREALRLQSVPDGYILPKEITLTDKFKLISNGVPTKKAELIAKEIKRTLTNYFSLL